MELKKHYETPRVIVDNLSVSDIILDSISWGTDKEEYEDLLYEGGL